MSLLVYSDRVSSVVSVEELLELRRCFAIDRFNTILESLPDQYPGSTTTIYFQLAHSDSSQLWGTKNARTERTEQMSILPA